ncbi:MAG: threonylcarbamoyl-AMP synthase [Chlorobi bacterium]|nr:threonylcarbamoyl-AMP synthase [Chlorobiota bacterium]MCI0716964.1 threonylcarbamoyl-AMP synthase [Chlorobiota bacterium]
METLVTNSIQKASSFIKKGEIAAFPTETVYGLGANAYDEKAVEKIFKAKGRPRDNPLIVHIANKKDIEVLAKEISAAAKKIIKKFFPGPVTVILKKNEIIPDLVTRGLNTIAVRMPSSKIASQFINACGVPIAAPSANLSGSPSPTSFIHVLEDFKGKIPCVLAGPATKYGLESTVVDCTGRIPKILRPGVLTLEELRKIDKRIKVQKKSALIKSPGQKYRHYSPKAIVKFQISDYRLKINTAYIGIHKPNKNVLSGLSRYKICRDLNDYAKNLFSFFRECDAKKIKTIYCQSVPEKGIGLAIMNRLKKATRY